MACFFFPPEASEMGAKTSSQRKAAGQKEQWEGRVVMRLLLRLLLVCL